MGIVTPSGFDGAAHKFSTKKTPASAERQARGQGGVKPTGPHEGIWNFCTFIKGRRSETFV